jgi:hypothetical protein
VLTREQARLVWRFRCQLATPTQEQFDALPLPVRYQLAALHADVLITGERTVTSE